MWTQCFACDIKQAEKMKNLLSLSNEQQMELEVLISDYLDTVDLKRVNPDVMGELYTLILNHLNLEDPYKEIKHFYNQELLKCVDDVNHLIKESNDSFLVALKIAITGNLIDFSANHTFNLSLLKKMIEDTLQKDLAIDDSNYLKEDIAKAKHVLYIGDNCGEIVLDKLFIQEMKHLFPNVIFTYALRGSPIMNDVLMEDAYEVGMNECALLLSNGDSSLGTVLEKTSVEFQNLFHKSDVVLCKGQGNYEGLLANDRKSLYFLFMAKCKMIADPLQISLLDIVCLKKNECSLTYLSQNMIK